LGFGVRVRVRVAVDRGPRAGPDRTHMTYRANTTHMPYLPARACLRSGDAEQAVEVLSPDAGAAGAPQT